MKFKIDENLPVEVAELLQKAGHDAMTVYDQNLAGAAEQLIQNNLGVDKLEYRQSRGLR